MTTLVRQRSQERLYAPTETPTDTTTDIGVLSQPAIKAVVLQ